MAGVSSTSALRNCSSERTWARPYQWQCGREKRARRGLISGHWPDCLLRMSACKCAAPQTSCTPAAPCRPKTRRRADVDEGEEDLSGNVEGRAERWRRRRVSQRRGAGLARVGVSMAVGKKGRGGREGGGREGEERTGKARWPSPSPSFAVFLPRLHDTRQRQASGA